MAGTNYELVKNKSKEFEPLFKRMDIDRDLYFSKVYEMMRPDDKNKKMENVINVTLNDPVTFAMRAIATMNTTQRQTVVEGSGKEEKLYTQVENFIDDVTFAIDDYLVNRGIMTLDAFLNEQVCVRGPIVGRCTLQKKNGKIAWKVVPLDSRFYVEDVGEDGRNWGAYISTRSKEDVQAEYGSDATNQDGNEVIDLWKRDQNIIIINGKDKVVQKNPYAPDVPFIKVEPMIGSMLADSVAAEHRGESIFWADRDLFKELNRTASIFQTINVGSFAGAMQFATSKGLKAKKPQRPPWGIYSVTPIEIGAYAGYRPVPVNDIKNAARLFYAILYTRVQQGGLSAIDYGNLTFPLSAVAITRLTGSRDQIFLPRIQAKAIFYQQLFKMIIKQYRTLGIKSEIGQEGFRREYKPDTLTGNYQIKFRFFTESKEQEIANFSVANAATGFLSGATIRRSILKVQDPEAEEERIAVEQAEKMDECLFLYNRCSKLIAQDRQVEAKILADRLIKALRARKTPQIAQPTASQKQARPGGRQVMPLLGEGGGQARPGIGTEGEELSRAEQAEEREAEVGAAANQERVA